VIPIKAILFSQYNGGLGTIIVGVHNDKPHDCKTPKEHLTNSPNDWIAFRGMGTSPQEAVDDLRKNAPEQCFISYVSTKPVLGYVPAKDLKLEVK
jgi:hypothetical protein